MSVFVTCFSKMHAQDKRDNMSRNREIQTSKYCASVQVIVSAVELLIRWLKTYLHRGPTFAMPDRLLSPSSESMNMEPCGTNLWDTTPYTGTQSKNMPFMRTLCFLLFKKSLDLTNNFFN